MAKGRLFVATVMDEMHTARLNKLMVLVFRRFLLFVTRWLSEDFDEMKLFCLLSRQTVMTMLQCYICLGLIVK